MRIDAELSYRRAEVFGKVVASLTSEQKAAFAKMKFGDFNTWPDLDERDALKRPNPGTSRFFPVAYMTYASEFFSWYAGSVEADTYFCPERHGTYFGSFYMKDMPAMDKRNYDISTSVTGDSGESFLNLLTAEQRANITSIPDRQKKLLAETVEVRQAMSVELRKFLTGSQADKAKVLALGRRYGALDGEMSWIYATAFAKVGRTLTPEQRAACVKLRNLDGYRSAPAYLYSNPLQKLPALPNSDFLFGAPAQPAATPRLLPLPRRHLKALSPFIVPPSPTAEDCRWNIPATARASPRRSNGIRRRPEPRLTRSSCTTLIPKEKPSGIGCSTTSRRMCRACRPMSKASEPWATTASMVRLGYAPPHSKGPGDKTYILTLYALSAPLKISVPAAQVTRDVLLAAMKDKILASSEFGWFMPGKESAPDRKADG